MFQSSHLHRHTAMLLTSYSSLASFSSFWGNFSKRFLVTASTRLEHLKISDHILFKSHSPCSTLTCEYWKHNHLSQRASNFQATTYLKLFPKHFCNVTLSTQLQPWLKSHPAMTLPLLCQVQTKSCLILWNHEQYLLLIMED